MDEHATSGDAAAEASHSESEGQEAAEQFRADAPSLILTCVGLLVSKAWEAMGLVPDPTTKKIERRLDDAQLAIDGAAALIDLVSARVSDAERRELNTMLMNLRINYVEQRNKA